MAVKKLTNRTKWFRRLAMVLTGYLLCWAITWMFAPEALNRWWASHHTPTGRDYRGNEEPVEFRTGMSFKGERFNYGPDFTPKGKWWCCVGHPWCPVPFVVASEIAWLDGPVSGYAGTIHFIWTPFGLVQVHEKHVWIS